MKKLSIIIPCYNEEEGIENLHSQISPVLNKLKKKYQVELILVNDGSTDNTLKLMKKFFGKKAVIISYAKNRNIGGALKEGFKRAKGDIIVTADSDCTYPPKEIPALLTLLKKGVDIVTASPYHPKGKVENVPGYRLFLSKSVSMAYAIVLWKRLYTYTAVFRAYRKNVIDNIKIKNNGFIGVTEILIKSIIKGYKVKEFPTTLHSRVYGQSKIKLLSTIWSHIKLILYIIWTRL